jgi:hypothetical protein
VVTADESIRTVAPITARPFTLRTSPSIAAVRGGICRGKRCRSNSAVEIGSCGVLRCPGFARRRDLASGCCRCAGADCCARCTAPWRTRCECRAQRGIGVAAPAAASDIISAAKRIAVLNRSDARRIRLASNGCKKRRRFDSRDFASIGSRLKRKSQEIVRAATIHYLSLKRTRRLERAQAMCYLDRASEQDIARFSAAVARATIDVVRARRGASAIRLRRRRQFDRRYAGGASRRIAESFRGPGSRTRHSRGASCQSRYHGHRGLRSRGPRPCGL